MVAYGVLEMKGKESPASVWLSEQSPEEQERLKKEDFERDQLRKLVNDELRRYGLLLARGVVPFKGRFRTQNNHHILYGQVVGGTSFSMRETIIEGTFKECCIKAAELLDKLDASQVPDKET
jgi:hypothetical protein